MNRWENDKTEQIIIRFLSWLILIINAVMIAYWSEVIWRADGYETLQWVAQNKDFFWCSVLIVLLFESGVFFMSNSIFIAVLCSNIVLYVMSLVNYFKYDLKGEVFQFVDISLYKEAMLVVGDFSLNITLYVIIGGILCLLRCVMGWFCGKMAHIKLNRKIRIGEGSVGILICLFIFKIAPAICNVFGETPVIYVAADYYKEAGFIAGFTNTLPKEVDGPQEYDKAAVENIIAEISTEDNNSEVKPNVIFLMEESLCDIVALDGVELSAEPLELFKEYQKDHISGNILSPTYGGNTCQVEFEVLTGYPSYNVAGNAYTDYIDREIESLATLYDANGYDTYAYHPNTGAFFDRNYIYNYMGFENIIFKDDFKLDLSSFSGWTDDESLFDNIISDYENRQTDAPFFAFVVTTQNHGGYDWEFTEEKYIDVISAPCEDENCVNALETYANLCKYSDIALNKFISYFETIDTPTIIVVWGDHVPNHGFFGAPAIEKIVGELDKYQQYHTTPLLIWSNYDIPKEDLVYISTYRLGAYVAQLSGISDSYMSLLADEECPNTIEGLAVTTDGQPIEAEQYSESDREYLDKIWMLEYDRLFGKNYYAEIVGE